MAEARTSCSLVTAPDGTIGVVTDSDMCRKVATGTVPITAPVATITTSPALSIDSGALLGEAYLSMVEAGVHHLVVMDPGGLPVGVIRALDVASDELRNPLVIRSIVDRAVSAEELIAVGGLFTASIIELVDRHLPIDYVGRLQSGVVDAIVRRAVELTPASAEVGQTTWLMQGSTARREPLPASDVDTAVSWVAGEAPEHLAHASRVLRLVERSGLTTCSRGANADNSLFNRSEEQWRRSVRGWLDHEEVAGVVALASIVADSRPICGPESSALVEAVAQAGSHEGFMAVLARHALHRRPPLGFVRDFVVESSGEHRGHLDLKRGGLIPISSLARWLALRTGDISGGTLERLARAEMAGLITADHRDMLSGAFRVVATVLADQQVRSLRAGGAPGSFLRPDQLDPLERRQLREAFRAIAGVQAGMSASLGVTSWA
jgi:CBS domain-containing protein